MIYTKKYMAKQDTRLIIYEKIVDLIFYSKNLLKKFPKSERFDLCTDIKQSLYKILRLVMYSWKEKNMDQRYKNLKDADIEIYVLKTLIRLSYMDKYITEQNYMTWNNHLSEIGKMIGGWMKTCQRD
mgnify:CR=1 FL=1